ncbi:HIT family protein [Candidatus Saccharibacteria bacterium]|nr:HIT family protein [Candidatus Saccharibacteria bacterium]
MTDSIFTKIIKGIVPCHKIYEDEQTLAFLDIQPKTAGHVLVVPKMQADIWDLSAEEYQALWSTVRKVADRIQNVLKPVRTGIQVVGIDIKDHAHVHVFPFNNMDEYNAPPRPADNTELEAMAKQLRF